MNIRESLTTALRALRANRMRSGLTILGIVIGISSVVFLVSFGKGHEENITAVFESLGANTIYVTTAMDMAQQSAGAAESLTTEDAEALNDPVRAPSISVVAPMSEKMVSVVYGNEKWVIDIMGVTPAITDIISYPLADGVFVTDEDVRMRESVAVLGSKAVSDLFGSEDPLGKNIRIGGNSFEVVGVLEAKGSFMATADNFIMIPLTTMQAKFVGGTTPRGRPLQTIGIKAVSSDEIDSAKEQALSILRHRHHIREGEDDDFDIMDMREILDQMKQVLGMFQVFLGSVGGISLIVGGIGIMNIMLVSVAERTREVGIRRALGAKRRDIMRQFLVESTVLSAAGGGIGIVLAGIGTFLATQIDLGGYAVKAPMSLDVVLIALAVAIGIGLASGLYPAFKAARLEPVEALRSE